MNQNSYDKFDFSKLEADTLNYIIEEDKKLTFVIKLPDRITILRGWHDKLLVMKVFKFL
ncbi:hypothetical protein [Clostridium sp.]|uniref:hypothetical protein n=1 Tax=Clostridium sp. TaxID=1506 RepID=UPI003D6D77F7